MRWSIAPTDEFVGVWIPWIPDRRVCGCLDSLDSRPTSLWVSGFLWIPDRRVCGCLDSRPTSLWVSVCGCLDSDEFVGVWIPTSLWVSGFRCLDSLHVLSASPEPKGHVNTSCVLVSVPSPAGGALG